MDGISLKAKIISLTVFDKIPTFLDFFICFISSSVGGYSEVVKTVIKIVKVEAIAPIKKAQRVVNGIPFSILSLNAKTPKDTKITGVKFAIVVPKPVKKLCIKKPKEYCFSGNLSEIKALYGSNAILFAASKIQSKLAAIHNEFE